MQSIIKFSIFILLLFPALLLAQLNHDVYKALQSNDLTQIENIIADLNNEKSSALKNAYLGALYMKQADFLKDVKIKISTFKKGKVLLENEIVGNSENIEYVFLRLAIQENAPKILKYNTNIQPDIENILFNYNSLSIDLKNIIKDYSKSSSLLNL